MTFAETIPLLLQGKKIRYIGWPSDRYLSLWNTVAMLYDSTDAWKWTPQTEELKGEWEIVEREKKQK